jgi:hypothetical protein
MNNLRVSKYIQIQGGDDIDLLSGFETSVPEVMRHFTLNPRGKLDVRYSIICNMQSITLFSRAQLIDLNTAINNILNYEKQESKCNGQKK